MSEEEPTQERLSRLDPDRARERAPVPGQEARSASERRPAGTGSTFDPRRYQRLIGLLAIVLVVVFSIVRLTSHGGGGTAGVPAGHRVPSFAAPLATSNLVGDADLQPPCTAARHDPRALNICLLVARGPLVLGFFVTGAGPCERAIGAMSALAPRFARSGVQFAAVAVHAGRRPAAAAVRRHGWRIPVAYDRDGALGERYGVVVCPLIELVRRGGVVAQRLIGKRWERPAPLAARIRTQLLGAAAP